MYKMAELMCDYVLYAVPRSFDEPPVQRDYALGVMTAPPTGGHVVEQQYLPDKMLGTKYFVPDGNVTDIKEE